MGHFSDKLNSKLYRAHKKAINNRFDSLGNKIKELGLAPEKQKSILDILDEEYLKKQSEVHAQNLAGTLPDLKPEEVETLTSDPGDAPDDLSEMLGETKAPGTPEPVTAPATPTKPRPGNKKK